MLRPRTRLSKKKIKEDKLVTFYFNAIEFYEKYQNYILGGLTAIVVLVLIGVFITNAREANEREASRKLAAARLELAKMNTIAAVDTLESIVNEYEGTSSAGIGCFYLANTYFLQKNFESAQQYFKKYVDDYNDPIFSSSSLAGIAACLEEKEEYRKAAEMYEKSVKKYPDVFNAAERLMNAARCYRLAGIKENAREIYQTIIEKYPNSGHKNDAELYLAQLEA